MFKRAVFALAMAVATTGCGGDDNDFNGSLSFNHSGSVNGSFSAVGRIPLGDFSGSPWAIGSRDDQNEGVLATALQPKPNDRYDTVMLLIPRISPGSATIDPNCAGPDCAFISVEFGLSESDDNFAFICFLDAGTVAISSISDNRVSGSFSGTGTCTGASGPPSTFAVTNGAFNVPLISAGGFPFLRAP